MVFSQPSYEDSEVRLAAGLTDQSIRMWDIYFVNSGLLDGEFSLVNKKAIAMVKSGTQFLGGRFVVPLLWRGGAKTDYGNGSSALMRLRHSRCEP